MSGSRRGHLGQADDGIELRAMAGDGGRPKKPGLWPCSRILVDEGKTKDSETEARDAEVAERV